MEEMLFGKKKRSSVADGSIDFGDMTPAGWSNSSVLTSAVKAPNGDDCAEWRSDGSSCLRMDMTELFGQSSFSIGYYYRASSYQPQYGTAPPSGRIFQLDSFSSIRAIACTVLPGTGTSSQPLYDGVGYDGKVGYSNSHRSPVNTWCHFLLSFDRETNTIRAFFDGVRFLQDSCRPPFSMMMALGGISDRSGVTGANDARYGFRGLMSTPRYTGDVVVDNFNPLDW